jgi:hypothetical protein
LFFFCAFRWDVGCDFRGYDIQYNIKFANIELASALQHFEPGYTLLIYLMQQAGLNWAWLNVISCVCFFVGLNAVARRQPDPFMFLTLCFPALMMGLAMSAVRQALALGFLCFAYNAYCDGARSRFIGLVLLAATFHRSAIGLMAIAPFMFGGSRTLKQALGILGAVGFVFAVSGGEAVQQYSELYVTSGVEAGGGRYRAIPIFLAGVWFVASLRKKWSVVFPQDYNLVSLLSIALLLVLPLGLYSTVMGDRFGYYLMPIEYLVFARGQFLVPSQERVLAFLGPLAIGVVYLVAWWNLSVLATDCYFPYQTWLEAG